MEERNLIEVINMAFASPGVTIKEIDLTPSINVSDQNIAVVVIAAETGPVDTVTQIGSEKELVEVFGKPNNDNYESWFAAAEVIRYGGIVSVIRPSHSSLATAVNGGTITGGVIASKFDYDNYSGTAFKFASRTAGLLGNAVTVVAVDHGADQIITYSGTNPTVTAGDAIVIKAGATVVGTGWIYKLDSANKKLFIILNDTTKRIPITGNSTYSITDNAGSPVVLVAAGTITAVSNTYYDDLIYVDPATPNASNYKWRDIAPQPGTSSSVDKKGGRFDEMHMVVLDATGAISGTANTVLERFAYVSKAKDATTLDGVSTYFHTILSERSKYVYPGFSTGINFITGPVVLEGATNAVIGETNSTGKLYSQIVSSGLSVLSFPLTGGTDYDFNGNLDSVEAAVTAGYELVRDSETFNDIDFLVPGKILSDRVATLVDIAESRRDCMAVVSPRRTDVINGSTSLVKTENIIEFFNTIPRNSFVIFDSGYKYIYDRYNDAYRYVPCAADVAGLCISTTINAETWFSPAGYNRGNLKNATKLAYSPRQSERDRLYTNGINPIVSFPGQGIVLFGDKTALSSPSAFSRINVRRLFIEIEKNIALFAKYQLFEVNDEVTRSSFKSTVEPYLRGVQGRRGIYTFLVVCDETNNTPDVIDRNELNAEIYIQAARSTNNIVITFVATRTGVSFGELTQ